MPGASYMVSNMSSTVFELVVKRSDRFGHLPQTRVGQDQDGTDAHLGLCSAGSVLVVMHLAGMVKQSGI